MKTFILILLAVFSFVSCNGQAGGLGFWNPSQHQGGDTLNYMNSGYILVREEAGAHYAYMLPEGRHALVKYMVYPSNGQGIVLYGTLDVPGNLIGPSEIKEAGGYLFILDRGGTRITRIEAENPSNVSVVFDNISTPYPLITITPLLQPGDPISEAKFFGVYHNSERDIYYQYGDSLRLDYTTFGYRGTVSSWALLAEIKNTSEVVLRTGVPLTPSGRGVVQGELGLLSASLTSTTQSGVERIVTTTNTGTSQTNQSVTTILNSDDLWYGLASGHSGAARIVITSISLPALMTSDMLADRSPSVNVGVYRGMLSTQYFSGYGDFTAMRWEGGDLTYGPVFNSLYWSPILQSSSSSIYVISYSAAPGQKMLYRLHKDGSYQWVRGLVN